MTNKKLPYGYGLAIPTRFGLYIRRIQLRKWTISFWIVGLFIGLFYSYIIKPVFLASPKNLIDILIFSLVFFLWGCPGFIFTIRKEALARGGLTHGRDALIAGIITMLTFWGIALYGLYLAMKEILAK